MTLTIRSSAFEHEATIPTRYSCEGDDLAPPLAWEGVPGDAETLALIVDDPDAPDPEAPKMTFVHWVLYNLPADGGGLPEACTTEDLPPGTGEGLNDWERPGYGGPCPPVGRHRYYFKLYALDARLGGLDNPTKDELLAAMEGKVVGEAVLMGTYQKGD